MGGFYWNLYGILLRIYGVGLRLIFNFLPNQIVADRGFAVAVAASLFHPK